MEINKPDVIFKDTSLTEALLSARIQVTSDTRRSIIGNQRDEQISSSSDWIITVPIHDSYKHTSFSGEPVLAVAAAQILRLDKSPGLVFRGVDACLGNIFKARGERGELFARLLLTMAHDQVIGENEDRKNNTRTPPRFTEPIKLIDFLKALINDTRLADVLSSKPAERTMVDETLEMAFKDAYINFTHFCRCDDFKVAKFWFAWQGLFRSAAFMCRAQQPMVDLIIPILFSKPDQGPEHATLSPENASAVLIQVKNRATAKKVLFEEKKFKFFDAGGGMSEKDFGKRPYLYLLMELDGGEWESETDEEKKDQGSVKPTTAPIAKTRLQTEAEKDRPRSLYKIKLDGSSRDFRSTRNENEGIVRRFLQSSSYSDEHPRLSDETTKDVFSTNCAICAGGYGNLVNLET